MCILCSFSLLWHPVKLGELQEALDSFEKSLDMAKVQGDTAAEAAIKKALEDVNNRIVRGVQEGDEEEERDSARDRDHQGEEALQCDVHVGARRQ